MFISTEKGRLKYFGTLTWTHTATICVLHWTGLKKMIRSHSQSPLGCCSNRSGMSELVLWRKNFFFFNFLFQIVGKEGPGDTRSKCSI